jgi:hypothetical protein
LGSDFSVTTASVVSRPATELTFCWMIPLLTCCCGTQPDVGRHGTGFLMPPFLYS